MSTWFDFNKQKLYDNETLKFFILNQEFKVYLFGSCLKKIDPKDIDLLIVYKKFSKSFKKLKKISIDNLKLHITFLSEEEFKEDLFFLRNIKTYMVRLK